MSRSSRRDFARAAAGAALPFLGCGSSTPTNPTGKNVVVLGLDGLDPKLIAKLMADGRAPNFVRLAQMGSFHNLGTTMPALSPVAWSSFITGLTPGGHGVADFVMRDPYTYDLYSAIWDTNEIGASIEVGDYQIALSGGEPYSHRQGKPFWAYLTERGIPATVLKIPTNFPVDQTATRAISGMGTPDLADMFGKFHYFTSDVNETYEDISGGEVHHVVPRRGRVDTDIPGPDNTLRRSREHRATAVPMTVYPDASARAARIDVAGRTLLLNEGEWSDWVNLRFDLVPYLAAVSGNARVFLRQVEPHLQLYITPINLDPAEQAAPVTYPAEVGGEIASQIGPFWTRGLPSDTKALDYKIFRDEDYVAQSELILEDRMRLFDYEWSQYKGGLFYFYVSSTDQDTHMLWRNMDETHPSHKESDTRFKDYIPHLYEQTDKLVGKVLDAADDDTLVLVCSDHGFAPFGRQFHLNTWLRDNGYLALKPEARNKEKTTPADIDWSATAAYGIGFNGIYINRAGREQQGIIGRRKADEIIARLTAELETLTDPETGERPVHKIYSRDSLYEGEMTAEMPEIFVGYTPGYRSSSDSVIGGTGKATLDLNPWAWAGDHSMAMNLVPGCLFSSRKIANSSPNILDLPVTILDFYGIEKPEQMVGKTLL